MIFFSSEMKSERTYRTAQPPTLAAFPPWGSSEGAGRMSLTAAKVKIFFVNFTMLPINYPNIV